MSGSNKKSEDKRIVREDFQESLTHERPEPVNTAPISRPSNQQDTQNQQQDAASNEKK